MALIRMKSQKGKRIVYTVPSFNVAGYVVSWGAFRMYTPMGDQTDGEDFKYFDVPGGSYDFSPHATLRKSAFVHCEVGDGEVRVTEVLEGADSPLDTEEGKIGKNKIGDIFIRGHVDPTDEGGGFHFDVMEPYDDGEGV